MRSYISCSYIGAGDESEVVEIGMVGESEARFHSYIRPTGLMEIDKGELNQWGLNHRPLLKAPRLDNIFDLVQEKLDVGPIYGYNLSPQLEALTTGATARDIRDAKRGITKSEWRDLKGGALEHSAVQGRDPSLRRVCENLEITIGNHGLKGAVHRAILCRRLHEVLLKDPEEDAPYTVVAGSERNREDNREGQGRFGETQITDSGDTEAGVQENKGGGTSRETSLLYVSSAEMKYRDEDEKPQPIFIGVETIGPVDDGIVVRIAAVSGRGRTILDATVHPGVDDLFSERLNGSANGSTAGDNEGDNEGDEDDTRSADQMKNGEAAPIREEEILFAPSFERVMNEVLSRLNRSRPGDTKAWVYSETNTPKALSRTAAEAGLPDLETRIEATNWHYLNEQVGKRTGDKALGKAAKEAGYEPEQKGGSSAREKAQQMHAVYEHLRKK